MRIALFLVAVFCSVLPAAAQLSYGGGSKTVASAGLMYAYVDFSFDRADAPGASFSFEDPAYGIFYSRPGFSVSFLRGQSDVSDEEEITLIDVAILAWVDIRPFEKLKNGSLDVFFPLGVSTDYRKVNKDIGSMDSDVFEVTVLALGAGVGIAKGIAGSDISIRSVPYFGIASRSFGSDTGTSFVFKTDVEWVSPAIRDRFGIYLSYGYRYQTWNTSAIRLGDSSSDSDFDYDGFYNSFRAGLTF